MPKTTHDINIIIDLDSSKVEKFISAFSKDFYISREGIEGMLKYGISFNIIHQKTGLKIDFWPVNKKDPWRVLEFKRRLKKKVFGKEIFIISPEDLILIKLQWFKESEST